MFKFNFSSENSESSEPPELIKSWLESREIIPQDHPYPSFPTSEITIGDVTIKAISSEKVTENLKNDSNLVKKIESEHSDLLTAVYEGGLKVWECTYDLLNFLAKTQLELSEKRILDLGCGAGFVGIFAALKGAQSICFQDYNSEVLEALTVPNCTLNIIPIDKCKFYSGDWASFTNLLHMKFDYIFTSETIYNVDNYPKLVELFKKLLKPNGYILLAAKRIYFGVGGSIDLFVEFAKSNQFLCETCWECEQGVKRAIIKINNNKE